LMRCIFIFKSEIERPPRGATLEGAENRAD
jgi:hypothetical protein